MITISVGDIHGMADKLERVLDVVDTWLNTHRRGEPFRFVFLGDYIDRGPASREVLSRVRALERDGAICLRGNHEALMIDSVKSEVGTQNFMLNGGDKTIRSLQTVEAFLEAVAWMQALPLSFEDQHRFFVHAGIRPDAPLSEQTEEDLLWIREPFLNHRGPFPKYIVHGHSPTLFLPGGRRRRAQVFSHRCNLDTGAVYGGPLSAAVFSDDHTTPLALVTTEGSVCLRSADLSRCK